MTGAETEVWITYIGADKVKVALYQPIALDYGDEIYISAPVQGFVIILRYVAVSLLSKY